MNLLRLAFNMSPNKAALIMSKIYLDDFLDTIHIEASNNNYPTLQQLLEVWTYTSGIVLDRTVKHNFVFFDNDVNEITLDLFNETFNF